MTTVIIPIFGRLPYARGQHLRRFIVLIPIVRPEDLKVSIANAILTLPLKESTFKTNNQTYSGNGQPSSMGIRPKTDCIFARKFLIMRFSWL